MNNILIGIPAYNEERTIGRVIEAAHNVLPDNDIAVVDDGSADRTPDIVRQSAATLIPLPCNLGYNNAIETILRYATASDYDAVVLIDADGQHDPACLPDFLQHFTQKDCDVLIGSRYVETKNYSGSPLGRRIGMMLFSQITHLLTGKRIYDTTSGMKAINREAISLLLQWQFLDFHAEAIAYLLWLGLAVEEYPVVVTQRLHGESMYSFFSHLWYPLAVLLMLAVSLIQVKLPARK